MLTDPNSPCYIDPARAEGASLYGLTRLQVDEDGLYERAASWRT
ncbi:MAG: hypothetical protein ACRDTK_03935 [Mycobacterium sp.]